MLKKHSPRKLRGKNILLTALGLSGLFAGWQSIQEDGQFVEAQSPQPAIAPQPTATPWATPKPWHPTPLAIPTVRPLPIVSQPPIAVAQGVIPANYSPPNGVDMAGGGILRWAFAGALAEDEWFDIKIKPLGSEDSVFVDWTKEKEYALFPWSGWQPGLYTWQIGIVKGYKEGNTKHFIADTGRNSQPFLLKWQAGGSSSGRNGSSSGGAVVSNPGGGAPSGGS